MSETIKFVWTDTGVARVARSALGRILMQLAVSDPGRHERVFSAELMRCIDHRGVIEALDLDIATKGTLCQPHKFSATFCGHGQLLIRCQLKAKGKGSCVWWPFRCLSHQLSDLNNPDKWHLLPFNGRIDETGNVWIGDMLFKAGHGRWPLQIWETTAAERVCGLLGRLLERDSASPLQALSDSGDPLVKGHTVRVEQIVRQALEAYPH